MAKKDKKKPVSSKRFSPFTFLIVFLGIGGWWIWNSDNGQKWKENVLAYVDNQDIATLESRYTSDQIVEHNRTDILGASEKAPKRIIQQVDLVYYPYLLLNVKYTANQTSREGVLLWGLTDGEVVLNTETWEKTHGFHDCLEANANYQDLRILQALATRPSGMSLEDLQKELGIEREELASWIENAKQKYLIAQKENLNQLHFENPKLLITPQTQMNHPLVLKPRGTSEKVPRAFTRNQIVNLAKATFGTNFTIRSEQMIYLPVYRIEVLNADESLHTSEWNALTGKKMTSYYLKKS